MPRSTEPSNQIGHLIRGIAAQPLLGLTLILALSVALRIGVALYLGDVVDAPPLLTDQRAYHRLAVRLLSGHGFSFAEGAYPFTMPDTPTAHWSFLQSLYVAVVYAVLGVHPLAARLTTAILGGILLPWLTYRLAGRLLCPSLSTGERDLAGRILPLLAAFLSAVYAYFVLYAATLMTETLYICALLWSLERALALKEKLSSAKRGGSCFALSLSLGLSLGIAALFRQSILPWVVVLFAWLLWTNARSLQRLEIRALLFFALAGLVLFVCIAPFMVRNYRAYGEFLLLNSNAGYAMYAAQHPMHGTNFKAFDAPQVPPELLGLNEAQLDRELMRRGLGFILAEPSRYLLLSLSRVRDYFEFWPTADTSLLHNIGRVGSFGLFLPFMMYGVWLVLRSVSFFYQGKEDRTEMRLADLLASGQGLLLLFTIFYSLLHIFTWAMPRYRLPVDGVLLIFAAMGIYRLYRSSEQLKPGQLA